MRAPGFIFTLALFSPGMALADKPAQLVSFLETYCVQCHGPEKQKGDRRFDKLTGDFSILKEAELFQEILEKFTEGPGNPGKVPEGSVNWGAKVPEGSVNFRLEKESKLPVQYSSI